MCATAYGTGWTRCWPAAADLRRQRPTMHTEREEDAMRQIDLGMVDAVQRGDRAALRKFARASVLIGERIAASAAAPREPEPDVPAWLRPVAAGSTQEERVAASAANTDELPAWLRPK